MQIDQLWLRDFRTYEELDLSLPPGLTCIVGNNGIGKTNVLEALAWVATLESFRGADVGSMVRVGAPRGIVRAEGVGVRRPVLVETELRLQGRGRTQLNRQRLARTADLYEQLRVSVFAPDDLEMVKGSPSERRRFLDTSMVAVEPRLDGLRRDYAKVLKQRNALLRQTKGRLTDELAITLEVWNDRLSALGEQLGAARLQLVHDALPFVADAYATLAGESKLVELRYVAPWMESGLHDALDAARNDELRRGTSLVGPHRDDLAIDLGELPSRTHASQGEQRSLALALRLGVHLLVTDRVGAAPLLLLDDVFSELDASRSTALFAALPPGQSLLTSAIDLPSGATPDRLLRAEPGKLIEA